MSEPDDIDPVELHLFSTIKDESLIELLTALAYYYRNTTRVGLNHTVNFGKLWQGASKCEHGLVSLPYLDGPPLENLEIGNKTVKFYWLIPLTKAEVEYMKRHGVDALERKFEGSSFNYLDPCGRSVT